MKAQELRNKYLKFFESKGHEIIPSASLVPENDASVLFTTAGMHPLVPYLMGEKHPKGTRLTNVQKCIRTGDIDEVGDNTHGTFFEMLGNWSLGDYFKKETIEYSFEFLTSKEYLGIPKERLAVSVFAGDDDAPRDEESASVWLSLGIPKERIAYLPKKNNWWIAGDTGPCGPDTEMFYWIDSGTPAPENFQETESDPRWVEIWNDVFMQYEKKADGSIVELPQKNVDTGMGLDRTLAVLNGQTSSYDTELYKPLWDVLALSQEVMTNDEVKKARIVLDHIRAATFIISDGVEPSNKDRGYVLRKLLRRAMVNAKLLNLKPHWLEALVGRVIETYAEAYPELLENSNVIIKAAVSEEDKFSKSLDKGLKEFEKHVKEGKELTGTDAFNLYQTFGFPWEITSELAEGMGIKVDKETFATEFKKHQDQSRTAAAGMFKGGLANHNEQTVKLHTVTHLLHQALRDVLGNHVFQKGSNITEERTRFDFIHDKKMTPEEIKATEDKINGWIKDDLVVKWEMVPLEEARNRNAIGLFGEKYEPIVKIYTMSKRDSGEPVSVEFCGGPHVEHTALVGGTVKIQKEEAVSAGVRRIKAVIQ